MQILRIVNRNDRVYDVRGTSALHRPKWNVDLEPASSPIQLSKLNCMGEDAVYQLTYIPISRGSEIRTRVTLIAFQFDISFESIDIPAGTSEQYQPSHFLWRVVLFLLPIPL